MSPAKRSVALASAVSAIAVREPGDRRVLVQPAVAAVGVEEGEGLLDQAPGAGVMGGAGDGRGRVAAEAVVLVPGARRRSWSGGGSG